MYTLQRCLVKFRSSAQAGGGRLIRSAADFLMARARGMRKVTQRRWEPSGWPQPCCAMQRVNPFFDQ